MIPWVLPRLRARLSLFARTVCAWTQLDNRHHPHRWQTAVRYAVAGAHCSCRRCRRADLIWPPFDRSQLDRDRMWWAAQ